jgi:hypothetical protein
MSFLESTVIGALNNFVSMFNSDDGYALPSRYEVHFFHPASTLANPANLQGGVSTTSKGAEKLILRCESISMPGITVQTSTDVNINGPTRDVVDGIQYAEEINMTFQASSDLAERTFFEGWQKMAFNEKTWNIGYYNEYIGSVEIFIIDQQNNKRYGIKLWEAFPKNINAIELSYAPASEVMKIQVGLAFRYWTILDDRGGGKGPFDKILGGIGDAITTNITKNIPAVLRKL